MRKHTVYFGNGCIMEIECGRAKLKRVIKDGRGYNHGVFFQPNEKWKRACAEFDWKLERGIIKW